MKYAIISTVISTIVAILVFLIDFGFSKNDKYYVALILILLMISGVYFSIKDINLKDGEAKSQGVIFDTTLSNTETIKLKADSIITNLNESLDNVIKINDSVVGFNESLKKVQIDVSNQIQILENTLKQTKIFEEKVSEQLKIDKERFKTEASRIDIFPNDIQFIEAEKDTSLLALKVVLRNVGIRTAIKFKFNWFLIVTNDNNDVIYHFFCDVTDVSTLRGKELENIVSNSQAIIAKDIIIGTNNKAIVMFKVSYIDESDNIERKENFIFRYDNRISDQLKFYLAEKKTEEIIINYIIVNNINNILID
jgi:uncharacterized membrane protein